MFEKTNVVAISFTLGVKGLTSTLLQGHHNLSLSSHHRPPSLSFSLVVLELKVDVGRTMRALYSFNRNVIMHFNLCC